MKQIKIWDYTIKDPLNMIGMAAGICYGSDTCDKEKNKKRAIECIEADHGRALEWPDVYCTIDDYSARVFREAMRHIVGTSVLQESTRYVSYNDFHIISNVKNEEHQKLFKETEQYLNNMYRKMLDAGIKKEDAANILPLGMESLIVWKINLRALMHFMNKRLCTRAYKEIRELSNQLKEELRNYSEEWAYIVDNYLKIDCERLGFCPELKSCGLYPRKEDLKLCKCGEKDE